MLNEYAPVQKKYIRTNDRPFIAKTLRKENMNRTKLHNRYKISRIEEYLEAFKKQKNKSVKLLRRATFDYIRNIDLDTLMDSYKFWKAVKPLFSDKEQVNSSIALTEEGKLISEGREIAEIFNH